MKITKFLTPTFLLCVMCNTKKSELFVDTCNITKINLKKTLFKTRGYRIGSMNCRLVAPGVTLLLVQCHLKLTNP